MPATIGLLGTGPQPHPTPLSGHGARAGGSDAAPAAEEKPQGLSAQRGTSRGASGRHTRAGGEREVRVAGGGQGEPGTGESGDSGQGWTGEPGGDRGLAMVQGRLGKAGQECRGRSVRWPGGMHQGLALSRGSKGDCSALIRKGGLLGLVDSLL